MLGKSEHHNESIQKQIDFYRNVLNCMPNLVYIIDKDCFFIECNQNVLNYLNLANKENADKSFYKLLVQQCHWSTERMQLLKKTDIDVLLSGEINNNKIEAPVIDEHGNITYYLSSRIPLFDENKKTIGLVVILTDITEQKRVEEQLEKITIQLQSNNSRQSLPITNRSEAMVNIPTILLIEDNSIAQKAGQALLMQLDCKVEVAESSEELEQLFEPGKYNIVLMDIGLKDTSGYVLSKKIRQLEKDSGFQVPIIALTGYEADVVKYDCNDYYMEGAIKKPLTSEQAQQIIQHYIYKIDIPVNGLKSIKAN